MSTNPGAGDSPPEAESRPHLPGEVEGRTLCVVVHGIGDPTLGATVREVARGLTTANRSIEMIEETHWVAGPDHVEDDGRSVRAFPVPVLRDRDGHLVLAEVHWGDLSKFPVSLFGLVSGFFTVLFGLRYIAYQAVDNLDAPGAKVLRWLVRYATALLIGPAAATNLFLLFLLAGAVIADQRAVPYDESPVSDAYAGLSILAALLVGALLCWLYRKNQLIRLLGASLCGIALTLLAVFLAGLSFRRLGYSEDLWGVLGEGFVSYGNVAGFILGLFFIAIGLIQLSTLAVLVWMVALRRSRQELTSAAVACSLPFAMTLSWSIIVPIVWATIGKTLPVSDEFREDYLEILEGGAPLLARFFWVIAPFFAVFLGVLAWWTRRRLRPPLRDDSARLIVNPWLQWGIVAVYVAAGTLALLLWWSDPYGAVPDALRDGPSLLALMVPALGFLPILISQGSPYLRSALDLVFDVVNHFYFRFRDVDARGSEAKAPPFPVRRAIEARLNVTFDHFAKRLTEGEGDGPPWRLVVLSHSQGTVFAIEALNDPSNEVDRFGEVRLMTMGSPFSHIYQYYFQHYYPPLADDQWRTLRDRLVPPDGEPPRWLNLFRFDDYVGRSIDESVPGMVANVLFRQPRGHLGYWVDRDVIGHIESGIGFPRRASGAGRSESLGSDRPIQPVGF